MRESNLSGVIENADDEETGRTEHDNKRSYRTNQDD